MAKKEATEGSEGRYSLKTLGEKNIVWIEHSALSNKELQNHVAVAQYIAEHIGEMYTILESGQNVYIGAKLPAEYTHSKYTSYLRERNYALLKAKNRATNELGLLIETATNRRWEKTNHTKNKDAKYGMYRYDSSFAFPTKDNTGATSDIGAYDVELLICNASDGKKYLYDIVGIRKNTADAIDLLKVETRKGDHIAASRDSAFNNSISAFDLKSNTDISKEWQGGAGQKKSATEGGGARHSIKHDWNNTPYVVIGADILDGVPKNKWVKTIKDNLREKFQDGVSVGNNVISINKQNRMEMTFSCGRNSTSFPQLGQRGAPAPKAGCHYRLCKRRGAAAHRGKQLQHSGCCWQSWGQRAPAV